MIETGHAAEAKRAAETGSHDHKKPLGIYLHIPFCVRKCPYCDFISAPGDAEERDNYVNLLLREIEREAGDGQLSQYEVSTVFFGGGTPSLLEPTQIDIVLCKLRKNLLFAGDAELTLEMNPGTVTKRKLEDFKACGINRISIGVQSLRDEELQALGRIHRADDVYRIWKWTEEIGYVNRNIDLMTGIPGQTESSLRDTLTKAAGLNPEHISAYSLIVEEGTPFAERYPDGAVDEETDRQLYALTKELLQKHGYDRYEISNYAKPGYACRHNLTYWTRGEYLGFGIGAASMMNDVRFRNPRTKEDYVDQLDVREAAQQEKTVQHREPAQQEKTVSQRILLWREDIEYLTEKDCMAETMFLGLRLTAGVSEDAFYARYHVPMETVYGDVLAKHMRDGLLARRDGRVCLTDRGMDVSNYVMADFLL